MTDNTTDITIVGLGPGEIEEITLGGWRALHGAAHVVLRTERHPCVAGLSDLAWESCDDLYQQHETFADVYAAIAQRVVDLALARRESEGEPGRVVYAVPGHPWVGEQTTRLILDQAAAAGLSTAVMGGASFIEPSFAAVGVDPMDGGQIVDAMLLAQQHHPRLEDGLPLLVAQLYSPLLAGDVKLTLLNAYPPEHPVTVLHAAGTPAQRLRALPLHELDRGDDFDHLTSLFVPPLAQYSSYRDLQEIVAHLRAPEGCPWDREQTLLSLRADFLDECSELMEALDAEDDAHTVEEIGDVMLLATMLVQIGAEEGRFQLAEVMRGIVTKLIRRHPHVFGDVAVDNMDQLLSNWDAIKKAEKAEAGKPAPGPLDGIPTALPALEKARKLQSKAQKAGLLDRSALAASDPRLAALFFDEMDEASLGAFLWQVVALAHQHDLNAENALRAQVGIFRQENS